MQVIVLQQESASDHKQFFETGDASEHTSYTVFPEVMRNGKVQRSHSML